jgi:glycosyltransferase involved in cell wall biosynthesis
MLPGALDSALEQESECLRYEVIVVDNNSTDDTRQVVERYLTRGYSNLRYVFEEKQGVSYARNTGLANARAPIIAFADDDVRVAKDWVANIRKEFDRHPEVDFVGGKILPRWKTAPPAWLTRDHWWALALLDYGDEAFYVSADNPLCLPTANASFRSQLFERFGLFSPEFSGREDHEFLLRLWWEGIRGLYAPNIVVTAEVQPERLKKEYHRKWNTTTGKFNSIMRLNEMMNSDGRIVGEAQDTLKLFGVPAFVYRSLFVGSLGLIGSTLLGRRAASLRYKNCVWYSIGYIGKRYEQQASQKGGSRIGEIATFAKALLRKKLNGSER